ncbi:MAG TPA: arginine--tRNA ligase [Opitutaceae bacterium]|nr:arginine--tRNA ligase [Opitutaceae bacterium]
MAPAFNFSETLEAILHDAADGLGWDMLAFAPDIRLADPAHGDFQANGVLAYAKATRQNPRAAAQALLGAIEGKTPDFSVSIAGPGFINFTLTPVALLGWLERHDSEEHIKEGAASIGGGKTWVVDYSSPNTAKQMHVGHLRSAVIGEALARLLDFSGAKVVRDNHLGDWGTQFGKIIWAYKRHLDAAAMQAAPIEEFERLYKIGNSAADADAVVMDEARAELVKLQSGDAENRGIWEAINRASLAAFNIIYSRLGIRFDCILGESFYNSRLESVCAELARIGIAEESQGALVVFHDEHARFSRHAERPNPFIVRKADGAANYATTDLATIAYRVDHFKATGALYVVDKRQADHFEQLFLTASKWFAKEGRPLPDLRHVDFGTVLGEDDRPLKTRSGENIRLKDLLDEAVERSFQLVTSKNPDLPEPERREIAEVVGIGSVQYADLSQNRSSDYTFSWDKMISLDGNTAAYLLYAVTRIRSIFRKAADDTAHGPGSPTVFETPGEMALARKLVGFADALRQSTVSLRPHFLCTYLYELAGVFSSFFNSDRVLVDDAGVRARRLLLCARTALVLETGLRLLGLRTLARM